MSQHTIDKKDIAQQMIYYFEEHYQEEVSLEQVAASMYLSPYYISRIFKSETGEPPIEYLIWLRMEKAKELLENESAKSVQQVAASVGYEDAYHFSKLFKKRYGVSPSQVKKSRIVDTTSS